ncbi:hypothetical protein RJT34_16558 [Clitoria ternatea]|uniref:Uncharacterized protein n=1 Tax=Clitoria ternatea TaxID=43366 RepID=A0AAN9J7B7_CLITE
MVMACGQEKRRKEKLAFSLSWSKEKIEMKENVIMVGKKNWRRRRWQCQVNMSGLFGSGDSIGHSDNGNMTTFGSITGNNEGFGSTFTNEGDNTRSKQVIISNIVEQEDAQEVETTNANTQPHGAHGVGFRRKELYMKVNKKRKLQGSDFDEALRHLQKMKKLDMLFY